MTLQAARCRNQHDICSKRTEHRMEGMNKGEPGLLDAKHLSLGLKQYSAHEFLDENWVQYIAGLNPNHLPSSTPSFHDSCDTFLC